jgi:hypothetical protein
MPKRSIPLVVLFLFCIALSASAQKTIQITTQQLRFCEAHIDSMYCFLPTFGLSQFEKLQLPPVVLPGSLVLPEAQNQLSVVNNLSALMGTELSFLPLSSPASGVTFSFDRALGVVTPSMESLGPILSDRSETIGKNRVFLGFLYQHFGFDSFEGQSLKNIFGTGSLATSIDELSVDQFTGYVSYGLTSRVEISAVIPVRQVRLAASGFNAEIDVNAGTVGVSELTGVRRERSGIGDITFRVKGTALKRERGGVSVGVDVRTPTGRALEFLGAGAFGARPFVAASWGKKLGRVYVAPHLNVGYEFNGTSILGGDVVGQEGRLPRRFSYAVGTEVSPVKRFTVTLDFTGDRLFDALRTIVPVSGTVDTFQVFSKSVNLNNASVGAKVNPWGGLLLSGNLTWRVNQGGLRARLVPMVGASYTF